jgi:hypothetical protein
MYVEDLFLAIWERGRYSFPLWQASDFDHLLDDEWYRKFITSVSDHITAGKSLSTRQSDTILRLIERVRAPLVRLGIATDDDIDRMLKQPEHRRALYESRHIPREVRYLGDNLLGFRFKHPHEIIDRIKATGIPLVTTWGDTGNYRIGLLPPPRFDWDYKIWIVPVHRHCLKAIIEIIWEFRFAVDNTVLDYLHLAEHSIDQPSAIGLIDGVILANVCDDPLLAAWMTEIAGGVAL